MNELDADQTAQDMMEAASQAVGPEFQTARDYAKEPIQRLAKVLVDIQRAALTGKITKDEAKTLMEMEKKAASSVLVTVKGLGVMQAQRALDSALSSVADPINKALNFKLL